MLFNHSHLRTLAVAVGLAGLAAYTTVLLRGPQGLSALTEKHREIRVLEEQNADMERDLEAKRQKIQKLKHDPDTQEIEIRKRTKLQREGETKFVLPDAPAQPESH